MKALDPKELTLTSAAALAVHNAVGASTGADISTTSRALSGAASATGRLATTKPRSCSPTSIAAGRLAETRHAMRPDRSASSPERVRRRFTPRQRPRSPDRQASRERRRRLGGSASHAP